jgi:probable HAF family extracellular repeat protein
LPRAIKRESSKRFDHGLSICANKATRRETMNSKTLYIIALVVVALAIPGGLAAQSTPANQHHHYKLIDLGTFGGPKGYYDQGGDNGAFSNATGNDQGAFTGWADTLTPDPYSPNFCFTDCYVTHAFQWQNGVRTDLGGLSRGLSSATAWMSPNGLIAGTAQNGEMDPLIPGQPEERAVMWRNGKITNLGVLKEGGYESGSAAVNSAGQVTGWATNTIPDAFSIAAISNTYFPYEPVIPYQTRAFLWQNGAMQDLGTLGGPDAFPVGMNELGQVIGFSYTSAIGIPNNGCSTPVPNTPTTDPFIWDPYAGMTDIGTLGGTCGASEGINNRGQVVGFSNLAGDQVNHAFLWDRATGIVDMGTLGGAYSSASAINDAGIVVGGSNVVGDVFDHAFLWDGKMHDLGVVPGTNCSYPSWINAREQIVGIGGNDCADGFLWEDGGPMVDLNSLVTSSNGFSITAAVAAAYINDEGEIFGRGTPAGCDDADVCGHDYLLIPCDENHPGIEACDYSLVDAAAATRVSPAHTMQGPPSANQNNSVRQILRQGREFRYRNAGLMGESTK